MKRRNKLCVDVVDAAAIDVVTIAVDLIMDLITVLIGGLYYSSSKIN